MRREELYLTDIVEAADAISRFVEGVEEGAFESGDELRSAVLLKLIVIGEAASCLPKEFAARHPEVDWADIVAFRNIAVHQYFGVVWSMVWETATVDAQDVGREASRILEEEFGRG